MPESKSWDLLVSNARLLDEAGIHQIGIRDGRIEQVAPTIKGHAAKSIDADGGLVTRNFVDVHFHLDKVLSREHFGALNPEEAFTKARDVKKNFTASDVEERACRALDLAVAQGMGRMRAQVDVDFATRLVSFEGVCRARERFRDLIDVEIVAFPQEGIVTDPEAPALLREAISMGAELVGGLPEFEESDADQDAHIRTILDIAEDCDVDVEMHCDYMDVPELRTLEKLAEATVDRGLHGRVTASHCNALSLYSDDVAKRVIEKVSEGKISVAVLPVANLQMLGGQTRTPYNRGSSRIKELLDAGINVAAGADNMFDIWFRFNRMDMVEVGYIACLSGGMRTDSEVRAAFDMVTTRANQIAGGSADGISPGTTADMVVHRAQSLVDIFRNVPGRRIHVKNGRLVGGTDGNWWTAR